MVWGERFVKMTKNQSLQTELVFYFTAGSGHKGYNKCDVKNIPPAFLGIWNYY